MKPLIYISALCCGMLIYLFNTDNEDKLSRLYAILGRYIMLVSLLMLALGE